MSTIKSSFLAAKDNLQNDAVLPHYDEAKSLTYPQINWEWFCPTIWRTEQNNRWPTFPTPLSNADSLAIYHNQHGQTNCRS